MGWSVKNFATNPVGAGFVENPLLGGGDVADMIPGIGDARAQDRANQTNIQLAQANRDWMERMSNTAYQRGMEDMKKAGLNPILAYQQGGASVPTSTAATVEASSKTGLANAAMGAFTGISAATTAKQQANTAQAQAESTVALQSSQAAQNVAQTNKTQVEAELSKEKIKSEKVRRELDKTQIPLKKVHESAASMAQKGMATLDKVSNNLLKSTAKPTVDERTLEYKHPLSPKRLLDRMFNNAANYGKGK